MLLNQDQDLLADLSKAICSSLITLTHFVSIATEKLPIIKIIVLTQKIYGAVSIEMPIMDISGLHWV